jgi:exodeoxyribonuclease V gamma subunit
MTRAAAASLAPGFMVVHGNHPESLCELMVAWMRAHPLAPLEDEVVLVQSNGIAQWLKLALAADHAHGIAAALQTQLPAQALWDMYRAVLGRDQVPPQSPFDKSQLVWRLMRLLPGLLAQPEFQPLQRFLENDRDGRKRHQLAIRLADLLDQYQVYRADWLAAWADERRTAQLLRADGQAVELPAAMRWQPLLWRALLADVQADEPGDPASRAHVHQAFLAAVRDWQGPRPTGLPRRISVFGISSLPQQTLEVLAAVARWSQVLLCVHNPCQHDWSYIVPEGYVMRRQLRRADFAGPVDEDSLHLQTHPLLAAWGRQGRDFLRLLDEHDEREGYAPRFDEFNGGHTATPEMRTAALAWLNGA